MSSRATLGGRVTGCLALIGVCLAPALRAADRITVTIDNNLRVALPGHVSPRIQSGVDQGPVDPSMQLPLVTMALQPSASQQAALDRLLAQQQDPASPNYHGWLTPEQYADRFGATRADMDKMVAWLGQYGLTVKSIARGRNAISFGGAAGQIESAFGVEIHRYQVGGESHFANAADPTIPVALQGIVLAIRGLNDFRWKPLLRRSTQPQYTQDGAHYLGPSDIATIYDIVPLYNAGISGTGQKIAVAGQTDINMSDIEAYRTFFGLPANDPTVVLVPGSPDPGVSQDDLPEADLDLELSGSVARNATILFVNASPNFGIGGVFASLQYAIDENLAPVVSISYGDCELQTPLSDAQLLASWATQANAQGQTVFAASGDAGAADCFLPSDNSTTDGNTSLSVDTPGSVPEVTSVGGTEFNEGSGNYWNSTNGSGQVSARSYIPEMAWNDSNLEGQPAATGGGVSTYFSKPSWQKGTGVPGGAFRYVPDVSLAASPDHDGYQVYTGGSFQVFGGTSVGPPQFSGITVLLGQYLVANGFQSSPALGNINPSLYTLAAVSGVFHDITVGNNIVVPCARSCTLPAIGYYTTVGYDEVTGVGTPDVYNLVTAWHSRGVATPVGVTMKLAASSTSVTFSGTAVLTATVTSGNGGTPSGTVAFSTGTFALGTATLSGSGASATATLTVSGIQFAAGVNSITATYSGDTSYYGETATASVTVTSPTNGAPAIGGLSNAASYTETFAPGGIVSVFGTNLAPASASAPTIPLPTMMAGTWASIGGIAAPLYYVSPVQLNIQIPYELTPGSVATLLVDNNGESTAFDFKVAANAPAIFTTNAQGTGQGAILNNSFQLVDASHPATPGSTYIQIYCMGLGTVSNQPVDGAAAPSNPLAETTATPVVTIGGVSATVTFSGLAPGFVGEYQVNALVPAGIAASNSVPVSISIGAAASNSVTIAVGP
ncbi:MAG TPA: protease pro-enzyme activation domain-containing protein [Bryobacteraceae bacterium]|nr:protease pro-enzyme activation domain-containing protein [Bryobacteraceae bacterium]